MILYLVTHNETGKHYVGATSRRLDARWKEHVADARQGRGWALHQAIREHGPEAFTVIEVSTAKEWNELCEKEVALIAELGCLSPFGYNLTDGGEGSPGRTLSEETKAKIGAAHRGKTLTEEHRARLAEAKRGKKMPPRTDDHRAKIAEGLRRAWARRRAK